jgi:hypothetical protein
MKKLLLAWQSQPRCPPLSPLAQAPAAAPHRRTPHRQSGFANDYRFRSISQTFGKWHSGGFDYSLQRLLPRHGPPNSRRQQRLGFGTNYFNGNINGTSTAATSSSRSGHHHGCGATYMYRCQVRHADPGDYTNTELCVGGREVVSAKYSAHTDYFGINNGSMSPGGVASCGVDAGGGALAAGSADCAELNAGGSKGSATSTSARPRYRQRPTGRPYRQIRSRTRPVQLHRLQARRDQGLARADTGRVYIITTRVRRSARSRPSAAPSWNTVVYDTRKPTLLFTVQKTF